MKIISVSMNMLGDMKMRVNGDRQRTVYAISRILVEMENETPNIMEEIEKTMAFIRVRELSKRGGRSNDDTKREDL